ncbi:MAG TPA: carbohydrate porin [Sphingomonas sp.]|uniref:carbohydrate porin n=1 Tax=Sphingomonas sp. TaxID=28214 RepID=UPI002C0660D3|nr:carbohydrate porin [Sphingomonas sp.]HMI20412.1 carbohydrate porin [Sphingomonas sp.]
MKARVGLPCCGLLLMGSAALADPRPPAAMPETVDTHQQAPAYGITGDWYGLRTRLHDAGVDMSAGYVGELGWNFAGGTKRDVTETGQATLGAAIDGERLVGIAGTFQATVTYRHGEDLGAHAGLGTLQQVQEVYGRGQTFRMTQFWYEQKFLGDTIAIKAGRATVGEDFASFSCYFMNLTFCGSQPGNLVGDYWYNWPVDQWMMRVKLTHGDFVAQIAAYQVNPHNLDKSFLITNFKGGTGVLVPVELGWMPSIGSKKLIGSYKIGAWYTNANAADVLLDINRQPRPVTGLEPLERTSRYGFWINAWQQLTGTSLNGKPISGFGIFANFTQADRKTSVTDSQIAVGLFWKPPIASLPNDVLAFAVGRTGVNGRYRAGERLDPAHPEPQTAEYAAELYYSAHPFRWCELRPNVQYIHNPGGRRSADDIGVLGLKAGFTL